MATDAAVKQLLQDIGLENPTPDEFIVDGMGYAAPLPVENWLAKVDRDRDWKFKNQTRARLITEVVVHETVTSSHLSTVRVLEPADMSPGGRNLGVHLILDPFGKCFQHGDLYQDMLWHATAHNPMSIGIEVVNPYQPNLMPKDGPWTQVMDAPWAAGGKYVVPPQVQAEALFTILQWLVAPSLAGGEAVVGIPPVEKINIPLVWRGLVGTKLALGRVPDGQPAPGIWSHMYFDHADGSWLVLYAWLRWVAAMDSDTAYAEAIKRATGAHNSGVDLSDLLPATPVA